MKGQLIAGIYTELLKLKNEKKNNMIDVWANISLDMSTKKAYRWQMCCEKCSIPYVISELKLKH